MFVAFLCAVNEFTVALKHIFKVWWLLLCFGAALIGLGLFSLLDPLHAFIKMISLSGTVLFLDGILLAILAGNVSNTFEKNLLAAESAVNCFFAALLCFNPLLTFIALPLIMGGWLICIGIVKLAASFGLRKYMREWVFITVTGCVAILFGFLIIYNPVAKANGMLILSGAFWLLMGLFYIIDALRFKNQVVGLNIML